MKKHLQKSIEMDQEEDDELGDESGNTIPESLTDKETVKRNRKIFKNNKNKDKLRFSSLNLLKQAEKYPEKVLKKLNELKEKVKESLKDVIGINNSDTRLMVNKKGKLE